MSGVALIKRALWALTALLATAIALYGLTVLMRPGFGPPFIAERRTTMPLWLSAHLLGGPVALAVGVWQLNARLRARAIEVHRWMGRLYVVAVLIGAAGGLRMALLSHGGMVSHLGFGSLGILWLGTTARAYVAIRSGEQAVHRRWMIRSYALTLAAVTLRLYLPLADVLGVPFDSAYRAISWLAWVPNLLVAEWYVRSRPLPRPAIA